MKVMTLSALIFLLIGNFAVAQNTSAEINQSVFLNQYFCGSNQEKINQTNSSDYLNVISIFLGIYGILLAVGIAFGLVVNYRQISELKDAVKKDLERDMSEKANKLISEIMKREYDNQLNEVKAKNFRLESYVIDLKRAIENKQPLPEYPQDQEEQKPEKNIFDE